MNRWDIINSLIKKFNYKSYLEIGVRHPAHNFDFIQAEDKEGVDPKPLGACKYVMISDEFFRINTKKYDIAFIDGLHTFEQVLKDVLNTLKFLNDGGIVVCHDCNPIYEHHQTEIDNGNLWNGTCWKAIAFLRMTRNDLEIFVVDADQGCAVIRKSQNQPLFPKNDYLTYKFLEQNRRELLNLISISNFNDWLKLQ